MGDPFSVAGTAVGITSLGIQVCQIVSRYYSQYRGIHDEINDIIDRAHALEAYLKGLSRFKRKIETGDVELSTELQKALQACNDVLTRLKDMARRCGDIKAPDSVSDRMRMARKRLVWPFKRDTLMDLQTTLDRFQSNLGLALQLLGLDYEADQLKTLAERSEEIYDEMKNISTAQIAQTAQLSSSISNLSDQLTMTRVTATSRLNAVSSAQQNHTALVQTGFSDLSHQYNRLLEQSTTIQHILEQLVIPTPNTSHFTGTISLPSIVATEQAAKTVKTSFTRSLRRYKANIPQNQDFDPPRPTNCLCNGVTTKKMATGIGKWITLYSESAYEHAYGCPCFSHSHFSKTVGVRFTMCNFLIRQCIQAGFQQSRIQGWSNISTLLRYHAVVPNNFGIFKAIEDAQDTFRLSSSILFTLDPRKAEELLSNLVQTMRQCFGKTAHPTDINEYGQTVLERIMWMISSLILIADHELDPSIPFNFLNACYELGLFSADREGRTMRMWQKYHSMEERVVKSQPKNLELDIFRFLARRLDNWDIGHHVRVPLTEKIVCDAVTRMLLEDDTLGIIEKDCLQGAILRRSELDLKVCIQNSDSEYLASVLIEWDSGFPLVLWSTGLETIISSGAIDHIPSLQTILWQYASKSLKVESLQLQINSRWIAPLENWFYLMEQFYDAWCAERLIVQKCRDFERWRSIFRSLATKVSTQLRLSCDSRKHTNIASISTTERSLYYTSCLHATIAEDLWNAGHRDIDTLCPESEFWAKETPLWRIAAYLHFAYGYAYGWTTAAWLMDKGANAFWTHPTFLTTPAHLLARVASRHAIHSRTLKSLRSIENIFCSSQADMCSCHCSRSGCFVISGTISKVNPGVVERYLGKDIRARQRTFMNQQCVPWLYSILDRQEVSVDMVLAAIRLLTFEDLSLTHTCCQRMDAYIHHMPIYSPLEVEAIHDIEKEEMELLDELMGEFENEWHNHNGTFASFIESVWEPKMAAVRPEPKDLHEIYRETGVILSGPDPNEDWISDDTEGEVMED